MARAFRVKRVRSIISQPKTNPKVEELVVEKTILHRKKEEDEMKPRYDKANKKKGLSKRDKTKKREIGDE